MQRIVRQLIHWTETLTHIRVILVSIPCHAMSRDQNFVGSNLLYNT